MTVKRYVIVRILTAIPMFFLLVSALFVVLRIVPGDPIRAIYEDRISEETYQELMHELGLNQPIYIQYANYMIGLLRGDLGKSIRVGGQGPTVVHLLLQALPVTLELTIVGMMMSILFGIPAGIIGALKKNKWPDLVIRFLSFAAWALPSFFLGMMLQLELAVQFPLFPLQGRASTRAYVNYITGFATIDTLIAGNLAGFLDVLAHLFLPSLTMAILISASIGRISRANMVEVLGEDYIVTARAKGLQESKVVYKHAFRNAILPIFTITGMYFALMLGGSVIVEEIFSLPGMGKLLIDSITRRDYPLLQGCAVFFAATVMAITTIIDLVYVFLDPRIRY